MPLIFIILKLHWRVSEFPLFLIFLLLKVRTMSLKSPTKWLLTQIMTAPALLKSAPSPSANCSKWISVAIIGVADDVHNFLQSD